jgi:hypothetical protein
MSRGYRIQDRTRTRLLKLNLQVSKKKSRYRRNEGIELNDLFQTKKPSEFSSSKEVQSYIRKMEKFLDRKTQFVQTGEGVILDRKKAQTYQRELERINKRRKKERERIEGVPTQQKGKQLGRTVGEMLKSSPTSRFPSLLQLSQNLNRFKSPKDLDEALRDLKGKEFRNDFIKRDNQRYKRSFIKSLETKFGTLSKPFQRYIKRLDLNSFMDVYYATEGEIDINFVYDDNIADRLQTLHMTFGFKPSQKWQNLYTLQNQLHKKK